MMILEIGGSHSYEARQGEGFRKESERRIAEFALELTVPTLPLLPKLIIRTVCFINFSILQLDPACITEVGNSVQSLYCTELMSW